jgi:hypothetical protein
MRRILWLRCRAIQEAIRATDLLLRDGNCPLLVLNLQNVPPQKLKPISNSVWHRFHRLVENRPLALLVLSTQPLVQGVRTRIASTTGWNISALNTPRSALLEHLRVRVFKRGSGPHILDEKQSD